MTTEAFPVTTGDKDSTFIESFLVEHAPTDIDSYSAKKVADISAGISKWAVRNFESDTRIYDYFVNGRLFGFVDLEDQVTEVYFIEDDGQPTPEAAFYTDSLRENLAAAIAYMEDLEKRYSTN